VQAAVDAAAREATAFQRQLAAAEDEHILKLLDPARNDLIRLSDTERAAFMRAVEPVLAKYRRQLDPKLFAYLGA
jgi:TRAP-type C4-dicarboxylate transport system substrate-binding protein